MTVCASFDDHAALLLNMVLVKVDAPRHPCVAPFTLTSFVWARAASPCSSIRGRDFLFPSEGDQCALSPPCVFGVTWRGPALSLRAFSFGFVKTVGRCGVGPERGEGVTQPLPVAYLPNKEKRRGRRERRLNVSPRGLPCRGLLFFCRLSDPLSRTPPFLLPPLSHVALRGACFCRPPVVRAANRVAGLPSPRRRWPPAPSHPGMRCRQRSFDGCRLGRAARASRPRVGAARAAPVVALNESSMYLTWRGFRWVKA